MLRSTIIEQVKRLVYGGIPNDDHDMTDNLINLYVNQGIAIAVKQNYKEAIQLEGVGYVNNSFYLTYKGIVPTKDEKFTWKVLLPHLPLGIGKNEGISQLRFKDADHNVSLNCVPLSANQVTYFEGLKPIPNTVLYYSEGINLFVKSTINLSQYTASVTLISGGDSTNLSSTLNIPEDYVPIIIDYASKMLMQERAQPVDAANDGQPAVRTT